MRLLQWKQLKVCETCEKVGLIIVPLDTVQHLLSGHLCCDTGTAYDADSEHHTAVYGALIVLLHLRWLPWRCHAASFVAQPNQISKLFSSIPDCLQTDSWVFLVCRVLVWSINNIHRMRKLLQNNKHLGTSFASCLNTNTRLPGLGRQQPVAVSALSCLQYLTRHCLCLPEVCEVHRRLAQPSIHVVQIA